MEIQGFHSTEHRLVPGEVEVAAIGDIVSGPRTVVAREPLEKVVFLYLLQGRAAVQLSDVGELTLGKEDILVVFPGRELTVKLTEPANRLMAIALSGRGAVRGALELGYWDLLRTTQAYEGNYMAEVISRFHAAPERGRDERVLSQVEHLLATIWLRLRHGSEKGPFFDVLRTLNPAICRSVCLTTEKAAETLGISRSKLNSVFMSGMGIRPGEYISRVLTSLALADLFWTKTSVSQIAQRLGFSSTSAFATFLRRRIGRSPVDFRNHPIMT